MRRAPPRRGGERQVREDSGQHRVRRFDASGQALRFARLQPRIRELNEGGLNLRRLFPLRRTAGEDLRGDRPAPRLDRQLGELRMRAQRRFVSGQRDRGDQLHLAAVPL